jgi:hypothetical protein
MNTSLFPKRPLSSQDFASFGVDLMAYVKPVSVDGAPGFSIHAADGTPLTVVAGRANAFAAVRRHEMEPVSVH